MKSKMTAGIFALLFGPLGIHRFYLGEKRMGKFYLFASMFLMFASVNARVPFIMIMGIVSFIDAILLLSMPKVDFDEKYNQKYMGPLRSTTSIPTNRKQRSAQTALSDTNPHKATGIEKFKDYDYDGALEDFKKSLAIKYDDPAVHFNLACCYSLNERPDPAFFHLTKAVHFGFVDFDKIEKHDSLAFLRTQPEFKDFVKKGYQLHSPPPTEADTDLRLQTPPEKPSLLDQIKRLSELREQGLLTEEEFNGMRSEVLRK